MCVFLEYSFKLCLISSSSDNTYLRTINSTSIFLSIHVYTSLLEESFFAEVPPRFLVPLHCAPNVRITRTTVCIYRRVPCVVGRSLNLGLSPSVCVCVCACVYNRGGTKP